MATDQERLIVLLEAKINAFEKNMAKAGQTANSRFSAMERRAAQAGRRMEQSLRSSTANIANLMRGLGVGLGLNEIRRMSETWSDLTSRVNNAAGSIEKGGAVMTRLSSIARRTYSDISATTESFLANRQALESLGYSTQSQLDYTESLNNALVAGGIKGQRAESVQNALAKAMALGALRGQELNTVIGSGGRVAQALADGLGVSVNELRTLGTQGRITGDVIVKALSGQLEKLREEADAMPATIADSIIILRNSLTQYIGELDQASGVTGAMADGVLLLADNIDAVGASAAVAGAMILSRYVPAVARATAAQVAMLVSNPWLLLISAITAATFAISAFGGEIHPIEGDLASLHDYGATAFSGIKAAVVDAADAVQNILISAINMISDAIGGAEITMADVVDFMKSALNTIAGSFMHLYDLVTDVFGRLPGAVAEAVIEGMNRMIAGVESGLNAVINAVNATIGALNSVGEAVGVSLSTIGAVQLGRIENAYAGAGAAAGAAYAKSLQNATRDHIGNALGTWRQAANERAANRAATAPTDDPIDTVDRLIPASGEGGGGGSSGRGRGGRGGGGSRQNEFGAQVAQIQQRIAAMRAETEARRGATGSVQEQEAAVEKARIAHELLEAAKQAGLAITPELTAQIDALAQSYSDAALEAKRLAESQQEAQRTAEEWANLGGSLIKGFVQDLMSGKTAGEAFANALGKIADKLLDMMIELLVVTPLMRMFKGILGGGFLGLASGGPVSAPKGFASGGHVSGPGGPRDDKVPALLSNGEFVINSRQTAKHRALLEAINSGTLPKFATGGIVGEGVRLAPTANASSASAAPISITNNIKVEGGGGTPEQNADLSRQMARQLEQSMRGIVVDEMRRQTRPGNFANSRGR